MSDILESLFEAVKNGVLSVINLIFKGGTWIYGVITLVLYNCLVAICDFLGDLIPAQDNLDSIHDLSEGALFFLDVFDVGTGLSMVLSAVGLRFLIRRMLVIG